MPNFYILRTDDEYAKTFQPEILKGRFLSSDFSSDINAAVINERAAQVMGLKDPVGHILSYKGVNLNIIGVLKDFNYQPLYSRIEPLIILYQPPSVTSSLCNVRMKPNTIPSTINYIRTIYRTYNLDYP
ncbi:MAG: ABC transporter permease [Bacteroidales bacterium]|nr:ABC transporter permease [Bacteroidales bacterium]